MSFGPIELLVLKFPGNQFKGEIVPALRELVNNETIRIIDIVFVTKDAEGNLKAVEVSDLDGEDYAVFDPLVSDVLGLLSKEDVQELPAGLDNNSSGALMLFENTWATRFVESVRNANGEVLLNERIPRQVIEEVLAATPAA